MVEVEHDGPQHGDGEHHATVDPQHDQRQVRQRLVDDAVPLEAATGYIEAIAKRIASGELDLQVEGSIAKYFATEAGNRAADDAMQALGGYGYTSEFEVEKIKRDVKITCIYEGASEVQQNIISTFRWRTTVKSKGEFYGTVAREMDALEGEFGTLGCHIYGIAARALNETIMLVHQNRLNRVQHVMFGLADMMAHVEVGAALARKAAAAGRAGDKAAEKLQSMSVVFANDVAKLVHQNIITILMGTGVANRKVAAEFIESVRLNDLTESYRDLVSVMDRVADIVFER